MNTTTMSTKQKGNIGLGLAINYYLSLGYVVSLPLNDSQKYDLVVDKQNHLHRVSVRTTFRIKNKFYELHLRTMGGNQSFHTAKKFDASACDLLFAVDGNQQCFEFPSSLLDNRSSITLGTQCNQYLVSILQPLG